MRKNQVLTHFYQSCERSLSITVVFLTSKEDLSEEKHVITGNLKLNQLLALLECDYTPPSVL
ncbi:hypothetical protein [Pectobacterium phage PcCB7V]|nr:hypothetical protein [Pectobacterium phage PcCB7V]